MPNKKRGSRQKRTEMKIHGPPQRNTDRIAVTYSVGSNRKDESGTCTYAVFYPEEDDMYSVHVGSYAAGRRVSTLFHQLLAVLAAIRACPSEQSLTIYIRICPLPLLHIMKRRELGVNGEHDELVEALINQVHDLTNQRSAPVYVEEVGIDAEDDDSSLDRAKREHRWLSKASNTAKKYAYLAKDKRMAKDPVQLQSIVTEVIHSTSPLIAVERIAPRPLSPQYQDPENLTELNDGASTSSLQPPPMQSRSATYDQKPQQQQDLMSGAMGSQYVSRKTRRLLKRVYAELEESEVTTNYSMSMTNKNESRNDVGVMPAGKRANRLRENFNNNRQEVLPVPISSNSAHEGDYYDDDNADTFVDAIESQEESNKYQEGNQGWSGWIGKFVNRFVPSGR